MNAAQQPPPLGPCTYERTAEIGLATQQPEAPPVDDLVARLHMFATEFRQGWRIGCTEEQIAVVDEAAEVIHDLKAELDQAVGVIEDRNAELAASRERIRALEAVEADERIRALEAESKLDNEAWARDQQRLRKAESLLAASRERERAAYERAAQACDEYARVCRAARPGAIDGALGISAFQTRMGGAAMSAKADVFPPDVGDTSAGWAVFNLGTPQARIERYDDLARFETDEQAIKHCIANAATDGRCLRALCETYATDELVRSLVRRGGQMTIECRIRALEAALRAILAVSERHKNATMNTISDCARMALTKLTR